MPRPDPLNDLEHPQPDQKPTHIIRQSDARSLPVADDSVDVVFTSPPYWQKRDYEHEDQIGQEPSIENYVSNLMDAFEEWERVLTEHGTIFLNIGDTYQRKDSMGIPWRVAEAARAQGWTVRSEIIWHKPNGVPDPARDRFTNRHEHIFHFTPRNGYYFDKFGYKTVYDDPIDVWKISHDRNEDHPAPFPEELVERALVAGCPPAVCTECGEARERKVEKAMTQLNEERPQARRAMKKFEESDLTEEHVKAIRAVGISDAGKGQEVQNGSGRNAEQMVELAEEAKEVLGGYFREFTFPVETTAGWSECDCEADTRPGIVLDPFAGSGTTVEVTESMGVSGVGVDLEPSTDLRFYNESEYVESIIANKTD